MKKIIYIFLCIITCGFLIQEIYAQYTLNKNKQAYTEPNNNDNYFLDSNLFTQEDDLSIVKQKAVDMGNDGFSLQISNNKLELYVNKDTGAIRIKSKSTGYIWASDVLNINDYGFNNSQKRTARSGFEFTFRNSKNANETTNALDSSVIMNVTTTQNKVLFDVDHVKAEIKFQYEVELLESSFKVNMKNESINEYGTNKITSITFFKYFGSVYKASIPSYAFIPSGNGGLIRYQETPPISNGYSASFYGTDFNMVEGKVGEVLSLPIYGVVHGINQNGYLTEINSGVEFAKLNYSPGNIMQNFNMLYPTFNLRETYLMPIPGSESILMVPNNYYESNIEMTFSILENENANYVGMAKEYQRSLLERKILNKVDFEDYNIHIDYFGSDYEKGIFLKQNHVMTTTRDILEITEDLNGAGITNIYNTLRGFNKGGASESGKSSFKWNSKLGSLKDLENLNYSIYYNPIDVYTSSNKGSSNILVNMFNKAATYEIQSGAKYQGVVNLKSVQNNFKKSLKNDLNFAFDGIVNRLYGDKNNQITREQALTIFDELINDKSAMFKPNFNFYDQMDLYLNMNLYHDRLKFITDSVPFLEIVLKGYVPYYSNYLNFSANKQLDILKCVEYGTYPAYLITKEESYLLSNTLSNDLYATTYSRIESLLKENYQFILGALENVKNASIVERNYLSNGVMEIVYSNDVKIVVNYNSQNYTYNDLVVESQNYKVVK